MDTSNLCRKSSSSIFKCNGDLQDKVRVDHPDTLNSMASLAFTWKLQGKDKESFKVVEVFVKLQLNIIGANRPDTFAFLYDIT
jgi:hypothetical protein